MATIILPCDCTEAMREAYHEIARRSGTTLGKLIARVMEEKYPELDSIVEQIVEAGGPDAYHLSRCGRQRRGPRIARS